MGTAPKIRVLIADDDHLLSRRLAEYMNHRGFDVRVVNNGRDARTQILEWRPRFVLADLMLPDGNAFNLIEFVKNESTLKKSTVHVIVMSGHNVQANVQQAFKQGAKDYIVKPFNHVDVVERLIFHSRGYRQLKDIATKDFKNYDDSSLMLHLTDLVLRQALGQGTLEDILFNLTRMVSMRVDGVRCSIIQCVDQHLGYVVTSNDNRKASGIKLDLYKYPEVLHVMNTQGLVAIENVAQSLELKSILDAVSDIVFNSMIVCPVSRSGVPFGVLSLRMPPDKTSVSDNEIRFVEIVAHVVSLTLGNEMRKENGDFWIKEDGRGNIPIPLRRPQS